jgi:uncharacterized protein with HEPN domain
VRDSYERLRDMQEAIMHILKYTSQGSDLFYHDELVQTWVIHHLEIIGEATRTILRLQESPSRNTLETEKCYAEYPYPSLI